MVAVPKHPKGDGETRIQFAAACPAEPPGLASGGAKGDERNRAAIPQRGTAAPGLVWGPP